MLPGSDHGAPLEPLEESLRAAESWSRRVVDEVARLLEGSRIFSAYAGYSYGEAAAYTFYWFVRVLAPKLRSSVHPLEDLTYHVLAYREPEERDVVVAFVEEGGENNLARLADAAKHTGARLVAFTPPLPPVIEARLGENAVVVEVPSGRPSVYALVLASLLGFAVARNHSPDSERVKRLSSEVGDYLSVFSELRSRYEGFVADLAEELRSGKQVLVAYTTTMRPAAALLESIASRHAPVLREPVSAALSRLVKQRALPPVLVLLKTDVEEDMVRELKFKTSMLLPSRQPRLLELHIKTDPLTAPVYASLVVETLRDRLK